MEAFFPTNSVVPTDFGLVMIDPSNFDCFDQNLLTLARHFFRNEQNPLEHTWKDAFRHAEAVFNAPFGATIALVISAMVDAMTTTRKRPFSYLPPYHRHAKVAATPEEHYFLSTLHAVRKGQISQAQTYAMLLVEGADTERLLTAARAIATITGEVGEGVV